MEWGTTYLWYMQISHIHLIILSIAIDCEPLDDPDNGTVVIKYSSYSGLPGYGYNSSAVYNCTIGYNLSSNITRYCNSNGSWSGEAPLCNGTKIIYI